jgi:hypothetical protein
MKRVTEYYLQDIKVETKITETLFYKAYQDQKSRQNLNIF